MDELGFIHNKLDIKILILFVLQRLPCEVSKQELSELCLVDDGISYFDLIDCLDGLTETKHVLESDGKYTITDKGRKNGEAVESDIPFSVRQKAETKLSATVARMKREQMIRADSEELPSGGTRLQLSLSDGLGEIMSLSLLCASKDQATELSENFKQDAEGFYSKIVELLS